MAGRTVDSGVVVAPGWVRAERPRRICVLGWADLSLQAREGSGYNLAASELAAGCAMAGHEVVYVGSGLRYRPWPGGAIRATRVWRGVRCHAYVNSPNLSPAAINFRNMEREMDAPGQTRRVLSFLDRERIEIVHIHSLEGYGLDLIGAIARSGRPVVVTPHNYWFGCPQVDLLHREREVCLDYEGGRKCHGCLDAPGPFGRKLVRAVGHGLETVVGKEVTGPVRGLVHGAKMRGMNIVGKEHSGTPEAQPSPDEELAAGFEVNGEGEGLVRHGYALRQFEQPVELGRSAIDQNEQMLANSEAHCAGDGDVYARRRKAGMAALGEASAVIPPSEFVRQVYLSMGMRDGNSHAERLGLTHLDQLHRVAKRGVGYAEPAWKVGDSRPLRFGFFGTTRNNKGLEILVRAIPLLEAEVRRRCHFLICAMGDDWVFRKRLSQYPEVTFRGGYDLLHRIASIGEYDVGILTHVWFENSPLVMLEHLHAGKFTISSRLGGPPEWIQDGVNGLLVAGGDEEALAAAITKLVSGEVRLPSAKEVHETTPELQSYPGHCASVMGLYEELLSGA